MTDPCEHSLCIGPHTYSTAFTQYRTTPVEYVGYTKEGGMADSHDIVRWMETHGEEIIKADREWTRRRVGCYGDRRKAIIDPFGMSRHHFEFQEKMQRKYPRKPFQKPAHSGMWWPW